MLLVYYHCITTFTGEPEMADKLILALGLGSSGQKVDQPLIQSRPEPQLSIEDEFQTLHHQQYPGSNTQQPPTMDTNLYREHFQRYRRDNQICQEFTVPGKLHEEKLTSAYMHNDI